MHQAQGSAGQTRDDHHSERRQPRPVGQGECLSGSTVATATRTH